MSKIDQIASLRRKQRIGVVDKQQRKPIGTLGFSDLRPPCNKRGCENKADIDHIKDRNKLCALHYAMELGLSCI